MSGAGLRNTLARTQKFAPLHREIDLVIRSPGQRLCPAGSGLLKSKLLHHVGKICSALHQALIPRAARSILGFGLGFRPLSGRIFRLWSSLRRNLRINDDHFGAITLGLGHWLILCSILWRVIFIRLEDYGLIPAGRRGRGPAGRIIRA